MIFKRKPPEMAAAIDLGSNSFHMIVARIGDGHLHVLDRLKETVRLGGGLDEKNNLSDAVMARALDCLGRFGQRVQTLPKGAVRAVGTNTLRKARNSASFLAEAEKALGRPIEVIAGREEARLIYLGVAHSLAGDEARRLVVDIGGGSTELIIGERFEPEQRESLHMGCVSMSRRYFPEGVITAQAWEEAHTAARLELRPIQASYRQTGWSAAVGASGTLLSVGRVLREQGWCTDGITLKALRQLKDAMIEAAHTDALHLTGLSKERAPVFPGGVAVLLAVFEGLKIKHMQVSDGALREGLIYDLLGRLRHEDVRGRSVNNLIGRLKTDTVHAARVRATALNLLERVAEAWALDEDQALLLGWAAQLHELGIGIAHSQYHKHGAYIIENADLSGFSRPEQRSLALLVRAHRRKLPLKCFDGLASVDKTSLVRLALLLRLAVLLHRSRDDSVPDVGVEAGTEQLALQFEPDWLAAHPLTRADLQNEAAAVKGSGIKLTFA